MRNLAYLLPLIVLANAATALIQIVDPPDKLVTFSDVITLQGEAAPEQKITVNSIPLMVKTDGTFSCGLALKIGKNFVLAREGEETKSLRILKLASFPDIEEEYDGKKHWARSQVVYLASLGIIEGYPDGNFYPGNPVTRGEFASWLAKAKQLKVSQLTTDVFFDVPKEHWRAPYIKAAVDANYLSGYTNGLFGLEDPISRREAAAIVVRAEGLGIVAKIEPIFKDVPQQEKGAAPIYTAQESGLVIGVSDKLPIYDPSRVLTRAEAATLLSRFVLVQEKVKYIFDFEKGYGVERFCNLNIAPVITSFSLVPNQVNLDQPAVVQLQAQLAPRANFFPIAKVKADLTAIGGVADAEMYDDGSNGDETKGDNLYSLKLSFQPKVAQDNAIEVTAIDQLGWEGKAQAYLLVLE